jgi:hypothetical protein
MDLLASYSSESDSEGAGAKRDRDCAPAPAVRAGAASKRPRSDALTAPTAPAPAFRTLDADVRAASGTARRAANALFSRRMTTAGLGGGVAAADPPVESPTEAGGEDLGGGAGLGASHGGGFAAGGGGGFAASHGGGFGAAGAPAAPAVTLSFAPLPPPPPAPLSADALGLLDARSRRELGQLGLDAAGNWAGVGGEGGGGGGGGGYIEVSASQVRGRGWEAAALEMAQAAAESAAARKAAPTVAARVWNARTGAAETTTGASKVQKSKHQINSLAAQAAATSMKAEERARALSMQAALARSGGGGAWGAR